MVFVRDKYPTEVERLGRGLNSDDTWPFIFEYFEDEYSRITRKIAREARAVSTSSAQSSAAASSESTTDPTESLSTVSSSESSSVSEPASKRLRTAAVSAGRGSSGNSQKLLKEKLSRPTRLPPQLPCGFREMGLWDRDLSAFLPLKGKGFVRAPRDFKQGVDAGNFILCPDNIAVKLERRRSTLDLWTERECKILVWPASREFDVAVAEKRVARGSGSVCLNNGAQPTYRNHTVYDAFSQIPLLAYRLPAHAKIRLAGCAGVLHFTNGAVFIKWSLPDDSGAFGNDVECDAELTTVVRTKGKGGRPPHVKKRPRPSIEAQAEGREALEEANNEILRLRKTVGGLEAKVESQQLQMQEKDLMRKRALEQATSLRSERGRDRAEMDKVLLDLRQAREESSRMQELKALCAARDAELADMRRRHEIAQKQMQDHYQGLLQRMQADAHSLATQYTALQQRIIDDRLAPAAPAPLRQASSAASASHGPVGHGPPQMAAPVPGPQVPQPALMQFQYPSLMPPGYAMPGYAPPFVAHPAPFPPHPAAVAEYYSQLRRSQSADPRASQPRSSQPQPDDRRSSAGERRSSGGTQR